MIWLIGRSSLSFPENSRIGQSKCKNHVTPLYPNLALDFVMVQDAKLDPSYKILDMNGKIVLDWKIRPEAKIDVSSLEKGIYILAIGNERFRFIKK